jgi:hypothetical protein
MSALERLLAAEDCPMMVENWWQTFSYMGDDIRKTEDYAALSALAVRLERAEWMVGRLALNVSAATTVVHVLDPSEYPSQKTTEQVLSITAAEYDAEHPPTPAPNPT